MIKGDTALDMRGRCSAGQKVCGIASDAVAGDGEAVNIDYLGGALVGT